MEPSQTSLDRFLAAKATAAGMSVKAFLAELVTRAKAIDLDAHTGEVTENTVATNGRTGQNQGSDAPPET